MRASKSWNFDLKKQFFGTVGIDMIAGPSEVLVVADSKNNPDHIAIDLLAQAEHDELTQSILITDDKNFSDKVIKSNIYVITDINDMPTIKIKFVKGDDLLKKYPKAVIPFKLRDEFFNE